MDLHVRNASCEQEPTFVNRSNIHSENLYQHVNNAILNCSTKKLEWTSTITTEQDWGSLEYFNSGQTNASTLVNYDIRCIFANAIYLKSFKNVSARET